MFFVFVFFDVFLCDISFKIKLICNIFLNMLFVFVVMDMVIEGCFVIVMV